MALNRTSFTNVYTAADWPAVPGAQRRLGSRYLDIDCDVVVVGSGAGGAVMAAELAELGFDVVVLEEGGYHRTEEFTADATRMSRMLYRDGGLSMAMGNPPIFFAEGKCVGGSTTVNGGMSWRTPEKVMDSWHREHGVEGMTPKEMERYFSRVEHFISARFQDPNSKSADNELLKEGAEKNGWEVVENVRNQLHCPGTNNCAFGCPTGAKRSTLVSYVPRATTFGARVYANCRVDRVIRKGGRATAVEGQVQTLERPIRFRVHARRQVVLSCGAIHTPALLMKSKIRSRSRMIGGNLTLHPNVKLVAMFDKDVLGWQGVHQHYQVREFHEEGFVMAAVNLPPALVGMSLSSYGDELRETMASYNRMVVAGVLVDDTTSGRVRLGPTGRPVAFYQCTDEDERRFIRGCALLAEVMFSAGAKRILLPFEGVPPLNSVDEARKLSEQKISKSVMEVGTVHLMGTAGMGGDPRRHVCDSYGRVYGQPGLTIADASLFPTPVGVNPMETIMSLSTRNAERLAQETH